MKYIVRQADKITPKAGVKKGSFIQKSILSTIFYHWAQEEKLWHARGWLVFHKPQINETISALLDWNGIFQNIFANLIFIID